MAAPKTRQPLLTSAETEVVDSFGGWADFMDTMGLEASTTEHVEEGKRLAAELAAEGPAETNRGLDAIWRPTLKGYDGREDPMNLKCLSPWDDFEDSAADNLAAELAAFEEDTRKRRETQQVPVESITAQVNKERGTTGFKNLIESHWKGEDFMNSMGLRSQDDNGIKRYYQFSAYMPAHHYGNKKETLPDNSDVEDSR